MYANDTVAFLLHKDSPSGLKVPEKHSVILNMQPKQDLKSVQYHITNLLRGPLKEKGTAGAEAQLLPAARLRCPWLRSNQGIVYRYTHAAA